MLSRSTLVTHTISSSRDTVGGSNATLVKKHNFPPETFKLRLLEHNCLQLKLIFIYQVHFGEYRLRPEFIESTYHLYRETKDPYYLDVGKEVLENLQKHSRVECGFAAIKVIYVYKCFKQHNLLAQYNHVCYYYCNTLNFSFDRIYVKVPCQKRTGWIVSFCQKH